MPPWVWGLIATVAILFVCAVIGSAILGTMADKRNTHLH